MNTTAHTATRTSTGSTARSSNAPIDPLVRLRQLGQRPAPSPATRRGAGPATPRQATAPRPGSAPTAHTGPTWAAPGPAPAGTAVGVAAATEARLAALRARQAPIQATRNAGGRGGSGGRTSTAGAGGAGKRKGPAGGAKAASLMLSTFATVGLAGMFAHNAEAGSTITLATPATTPATNTGTASAQTATQNAAGTTATTATPAPSAVISTTGQVVDGTYVGAADSNRWGTVQVQAVYSGGQLVDVQILSYPDGDNKSVQINQRALPTLIEASISSQSADVSTVSGATYTSDSYVSSLQSAIDAALSASGLA